MKRLTLYAVLTIFAITHSMYYFPQLPDTMASHFGGGRKADNWAFKSSFFVVSGLILLLNVGIFTIMPSVFEKFRFVKMNLHNRDYWLAPENADEFDMIFHVKMCYFGIANLVFGIIVVHLVFLANLKPAQTLDNSTFLLAGYFIFVIIWLTFFFKRFVKSG